MQAPEQEVLPVRSDKARRRISCIVLGMTGVALLVLCALIFSCIFFWLWCDRSCTIAFWQK